MTVDAQNPGRTVTTPIAAAYPEMAGKTAVITGAARGMGAQFARGLATRGVNVVGGRVSGVGVAGFTLGGGAPAAESADLPSEPTFVMKATLG